MSETIRKTTALTAEENEALFHWGDDVFNSTGSTTVWGGGAQLHFITEVEGKPACHLAALCHEVDVSGMKVKIVGLGGIITRPEYQGRGYARRLMEEALTHGENEWQAEAGLLFCLEHMKGYYRAAGWTQLEVPVMIEQPQGTIPAPGGVFVKPLRDFQWPPGVVNLNRMPW